MDSSTTTGDSSPTWLDRYAAIGIRTTEAVSQETVLVDVAAFLSAYACSSLGFPDASFRIIVRGNGHYGTGEVMGLLEFQGCGFFLGLPINGRFKLIGQPWCEDAAARRALSC